MTDVILVNEEDEEIGVMEKQEAHEKGELHRCFSLFVFNAIGEMLIQRRAFEKYHCGGLWSNTCCSHPDPNEEVEDSVHRRLDDEMGFDCEVSPLLKFIYKASFENGLTEHEYDHVFIGEYDENNLNKINKNPEEVVEYKWVEIEKLITDMQNNPENYTTWFKIIIDEVIKRKEEIPEENNVPELGRLEL